VCAQEEPVFLRPLLRRLNNVVSIDDGRKYRWVDGLMERLAQVLETPFRIERLELRGKRLDAGRLVNDRKSGDRGLTVARSGWLRAWSGLDRGIGNLRAAPRTSGLSGTPSRSWITPHLPAPFQLTMAAGSIPSTDHVQLRPSGFETKTLSSGIVPQAPILRQDYE
jgi:hypothetical protein